MSFHPQCGSVAKVALVTAVRKLLRGLCVPAKQKTSRYMNILSIMSCYPPHMVGGAEFSALNINAWLSSQGHEIAAVTCAGEGEKELFGEWIDGIRVWRLRWPRSHTLWQHSGAAQSQKLVWQLQDHFDPRNKKIMARVLDEFRPDFAFIHVVAGLGYNSLYEIGARDIPSIYFMHDTNLICAKAAMYKRGRRCTSQCLQCKVVGQIRFSAATSIRRIAFASPSQANMDLATRYHPLNRYLTAIVPNPIGYPVATVPRRDSTHLRFLFVGRLHENKGIRVLLTALEQVEASRPFKITILGSGPHEARLRADFQRHAWCQFHGRVSENEVANRIVNSDVLCMPSIAPENSPGVIIHALSKGLPVFASAQGGIPELVENDKNGLLLTAGDVVAWRGALARIIEDSSPLDRWRRYADAHARDFDQDHLGRRLLALMENAIKQHGCGRQAA
jgi:glycosyltransferase involved in cell wall biosynthesis